MSQRHALPATRSCRRDARRRTPRPRVSRQHAQRAAGRLHARPCRPPVPPRPGRVLDRGRHAGDHGRLVARHRHLFRLPRRRADAPDRPAGGDADSPTRTASPNCARRSTASPAGNCSTRSSSSRSSSALLHGRRRWSSRTAALGGEVLTGSINRRAPRRRRRAARQAAKPSPISDTVIFTAPPDREARLESREAPARPASSPRAATDAGLEGMLARVRARSTTSSSGRPRRSPTSRSASTPRRAACAACSPISASIRQMPCRRTAIGGPFVPLSRRAPDASAFERQLYRINVARAQVDRYTHTLAPCRCASRSTARST